MPAGKLAYRHARPSPARRRRRAQRARHVALAVDAWEDDDGGFHRMPWIRLPNPSREHRDRSCEEFDRLRAAERRRDAGRRPRWRRLTTHVLSRRERRARSAAALRRRSPPGWGRRAPLHPDAHRRRADPSGLATRAPSSSSRRPARSGSPPATPGVHLQKPGLGDAGRARRRGRNPSSALRNARPSPDWSIRNGHVDLGPGRAVAPARTISRRAARSETSGQRRAAAMRAAIIRRPRCGNSRSRYWRAASRPHP